MSMLRKYVWGYTKEVDVDSKIGSKKVGGSVIAQKPR